MAPGGIMQRRIVDRLACINLPAFPLQLLLGRYPQWRLFPVAVVSRETAQGEIWMASPQAQARGVLPGLSIAAAMGLCPNLRAKAVSQKDIEETKKRVLMGLRSFSPKIEADNGSGAFWLQASGMERLYSSLEIWAQGIRKTLRAMGFEAVVVVGFSRLGTFALARGDGLKTMVLQDPEQESLAVRAVPLAHLELPPWVTTELKKLGKTTVGDLLQLPAGGLLERYGPLVYRLRSVATGTSQEPMVPVILDDPHGVHLDLDAPEADAIRLTFYVKRILSTLLSGIADCHETLDRLEIHLALDDGTRTVEVVRPAQPTLNAAQLIDLVRLRLGNSSLDAGVVAIQLRAATVKATTTQLSLFQKRPRRDLASADRALARLRAEFGTKSVVRLKLQAGHLPEAQFSFEPMEHVIFPEVTHRGQRSLVRRIFVRPVPINVHPVGHGTAYCAAAGIEGVFQKTGGPYILSGGWWNREIHREYYFTQNEKGQVLWMYRDKRRGGRWYLHGQLE